MGQIVKAKKKGRPSKADLARRAAAAEAPRGSTEVRRSLRRRSLRYGVDLYGDGDREDDDEEDEEEEDERRREKKLKLVLRLPPHDGGGRQRTESSGCHAPASSSENKPLKKQKIRGGDVADGDGDCDYDTEHVNEDEEDDDEDEDRRRKGDSKGVASVPGTPSDPQSGIPLPDKKSLELILDKLQKKDTYGVYAEPVDPEELPDYHDMIEHPMDFATVRKKLANGLYPILEQFESDVFLICSNAMQYNAPETIYFKQARTIQELARRKFERLRIEIERSEKELKSEQKTKSNPVMKRQIKKPTGRTAHESVGSDFSSGATLAKAGDVHNGLNAMNGGCERPNNIDGIVEGNSSLVDTNFEKAEELFSGKNLPYKFGRKSFGLDENRRDTYNVSAQPMDRSEPVFSIFEGETKQLVAVGLQAEYSYARSLARFAATLGPVAWKVASKRIEQVLPAGFKFGRGWVGEYEPLPTSVLMLESRVHCTPDIRKDDKTSKAPFSSKKDSAGGPTVEGKLSFINSGTNSKKPKLPSRDTVEPKNKVSGQVELNHPPLAKQNTSELAAGKQQLSSGTEMAPPRSMETVLRNKSLVQTPSVPQLGTNGVVAGGMLNGKVTNNNLENSRMFRSPSDSIPNQMARATTYFPHGQEQGFSDPVQVMKVLAEKSQKQQNSLNHSTVETVPVVPSAPSLRRDDSSNAVAPAWISAGAGGYRPNAENFNVHRNQISAASLYNSTREFHSQTVRPRGEHPVSGGTRFQSEKNSLPFQAFAPQPIRMSSEPQFQNRSMLFPHLVTPDLSRFQVQSPLRGLSPRNQPRKQQDSLPPDLNIGFQSSGSPVRQSSGVAVDSQQPDLALQL